MTDAEKWVRENSKARGSAWSVMLALGELADRCVAVCTADQVERSARISRRELYRALLAQEEMGEIKRLSKVGSNKQLRAFHFSKLSCANLREFPNPLCPRKLSRLSAPVPDLRIGNGSCAKTMLPFPTTRTSQEECEECQGSGWRRIARPDGEAGEVAIRCRHEITAIVGRRWGIAPDSRDDLVRYVLPPEAPRALPTTQDSFDWDRAQAVLQKARLEQWANDNGVHTADGPEVKREGSPPSNVICFQRKSA
jgi:hypothetical protein